MPRPGGIKETKKRLPGGGRPPGISSPRSDKANSYTKRFLDNPDGSGRVDVLDVPNEDLAGLEKIAQARSLSVRALAREILHRYVQAYEHARECGHTSMPGHSEENAK